MLSSSGSVKALMHGHQDCATRLPEPCCRPCCRRFERQRRSASVACAIYLQHGSGSTVLVPMHERFY
jgi:hypothetical protein